MVSSVLSALPQDLELTKLKDKLQTLRPLGEMQKYPELNEIRASVLDSWADCEEMAEELISKKLYVTANPHRQGKFADFKKLVLVILRGETWLKKFQTVSDMGLISEELFLKLKQLNSIRVVFSHPISKKYKIFLETERQVFAYKLMVEIIQELAIEDEFFGF
ncbi:MAG: hypothetical protein ACD_19C00191G0002 [uncultured bacterium]|nr:MAG: hypothetical protein ACD_19C00191G0002 [uncultured bacterium]